MNPQFNQVQWKDAAGQTMSRGCFIAYAVGFNRSAPRLRFGLVTDLIEYVPKYGRSPAGPTVQPIPKVRFIDDVGFKQTIDRLTRMLIVSEQQVPPRVLEVLRCAWTGSP